MRDTTSVSLFVEWSDFWRTEIYFTAFVVVVPCRDIDTTKAQTFVHQVCWIGRTKAVGKRNEKDERRNGCHNNREKQNKGKLVEEGDCAKEHDNGWKKCCSSGGQNRGSHCDHSVLGSLLTRMLTLVVNVGMVKVNDKIDRNSNQNGKANRL